MQISSSEAERPCPFETIHIYLKNINVTNTQGIDYMMLHSIFDDRGNLQSSGMWTQTKRCHRPID